MFGSIRPSVRLFVGTLLFEPFTHGIQSKISVCLSVIRKHSRSRAARSSRGLLIIKGSGAIILKSCNCKDPGLSCNIGYKARYALGIFAQYGTQILRSSVIPDKLANTLMMQPYLYMK